MAKNDTVLLDGIIDELRRGASISSQRGAVFENFVFAELLKDFDLSQDQISRGWVDGRDDGGIDGFYIFINGHPVDDLEDFVWPRSSASIDVWLITCKHHDTFQQAPLDLLVASCQELFDLGKTPLELKGPYSQDVLELRDIFDAAYRKLSISRPTLRFNLIYASRGDTSELGQSVRARATQVSKLFESLFSHCEVNFQFVGAKELVERHRAVKTFALQLPFTEHLATGKDSYVLLVRLADYWRFVSDESRTLRRYLFDSNVRDYLGSNQVNSDIEQSLLDESTPDFWWLNNGVTILATDATVPGKTIHLKDIQIVNGLQTTETIFQHFASGRTESADKTLLVKIIVSTDEATRDRIIRATNNQSPVEIAALRATDKIQRDIEDVLAKHDWYYERRKNYFRNVGKPPGRFITPLQLASAATSLVHRNPARATRLKAKFMRSQPHYEAVFSTKLPIQIWPALVGIFKATETGLLSLPNRRNTERFVSGWRPIVALIATARAIGRFDYSVEELSQFDPSRITPESIEQIFELLIQTPPSRDRIIKLTEPMAREYAEASAAEFGITGVEIIGKRDFASVPGVQRFLSAEFVESVRQVLPAQPWPAGTHRSVAATLGCSPSDVSEAITQLMASGAVPLQRNGVVYDAAGNVVLTRESATKGPSGSGDA